jgi:hypothetical protein
MAMRSPGRPPNASTSPAMARANHAPTPQSHSSCIPQHPRASQSIPESMADNASAHPLTLSPSHSLTLAMPLPPHCLPTSPPLHLFTYNARCATPFRQPPCRHKLQAAADSLLLLRQAAVSHHIVCHAIIIARPPLSSSRLSYIVQLHRGPTR